MRYLCSVGQVSKLGTSGNMVVATRGDTSGCEQFTSVALMSTSVLKWGHYLLTPAYRVKTVSNTLPICVDWFVIRSNLEVSKISTREFTQTSTSLQRIIKPQCSKLKKKRGGRNRDHSSNRRLPLSKNSSLLTVFISSK